MIHRKYFPHSEDLFSELHSELIKEFEKGARGVFLSGGSTPGPLYDRLHMGPQVRADFFGLGLSDERCVEFESPQRNQSYFLPLVESEKFRNCSFVLPGKTSDPVSMRDSLQSNYNDFAAMGGRFSMGVFGIGADGHTCGIFPNQETDSSVDMDIVKRPDGLMGVTITQKVISGLDRVILLAVGAGKRDILQKLFDAPRLVFALNLLRSVGLVEVWTDNPE